MVTYRAPGVYVREVPGGPRPIEAVGTSTAGFVGHVPDTSAETNVVTSVNSWLDFTRKFVPEGSDSTPLSNAVFGFFNNGGGRCYIVNVGREQSITGSGRGRQGIALFEEVDEIAIVAAPGYSDPASYEALLAHCERMEDRVAILDPPHDITDIDALTRVATQESPPRSGTPSDEEPEESSEEDQPGRGAGAGQPQQQAAHRPRHSDYGAFYFPDLVMEDPIAGGQVIVSPSGVMAGIWARTDNTRGVHKAPANEPVRGALNVSYRVTLQEQEILNPAGVNCIRFFPGRGIRVWGARTLAESSSEWRYLNVRRLVNMLKESIAEGTRWVVFEPNDYTLWKSIRRDLTAFLTRVWRDGALMGRTPEEAFYVKCDDQTNPPEVIDAGQVVTIIGIAPVKPAEFVIFQISQTHSGAEIEG